MSSHAKISYLKSAFRLIGYIAGAVATTGWLMSAFIILAAAEVIGIVEEFGQ
jgi:hypothetical protein